MANKTKPKSAKDRESRAKLEQMRREQRARERRRSIGIVVIAAVLGIGLVLAAAAPAFLKNRNDPAKKPLKSFGVSAAAASCSPVQTVHGTGGANDRQHVDIGTKLTYKTVPPTYGAHWVQPVFPARPFYTATDRPATEQLVHNLEHGYTIIWYDSTVKGKQLTDLQDIAASARTQDSTSPGKFIVSAWDDHYGTFPAGKHVALAHWGANDSHRQLCGQTSGAVVQKFIDAYPSTDTPEPQAQ
ncbi:MAG: hypothetical protein QOJ60_945 [Actinomycetota bacterium]|nr:hypothetical protein [Actinomycetota bacterium]